MKTKIVRKPPGYACGEKGCRAGILMRIPLSRLEEGLGHEGFQCDSCGQKVKYVPKTKVRA